MDGGVITFVIAILIIGVFLFIAFGLTGKRGHKFDMREYQARFLAIEYSYSGFATSRSYGKRCW